MADIYVVKRLIDYIGLGARGIPEGTIPVKTSMQPTLALLEGMGADGAKLVSVDANGNLQAILPAKPNLTEVAMVLGGINGNEWNVVSNLGDAGNLSSGAPVGVWVYNGATWDRVRSASAADLAAQSGLGAALVAPPGQWSIFSAPALSAQASASKAAGGAGVRHIATGYEIIVSCQAAPAAGQLLVNVRDGASGAGTILKTYAFEIPAAIFAPMILSVPGKSMVGTAATAMTIESSAAYAAVGVSVALDGYDAS